VRVLLLLATLGLATFSSADRLITIPTGTKITLNTVKFEGLTEQSRSRTSRYWLGFGVTNAIDAQITGEKFELGKFKTSFDVAYNYIPPITGIGPGISFGVQDVLNETHDGRRYFLAITTKEGFADSVNGSVPAEITIGGYFGSINSPFVGVMLPFTDKLRFLAEFNGRRITAGVDIRPTNDIGLRAVFDQRDVLVGAQITLRF
jgi:hypothetical protein